MRNDLAKCTTEQPRSGGALAACYKLKLGGRVKVHPDPDHTYDNEYGGFRSSARHRHFECKSFTDRLGALRGNLRVAIGRPWNDVYSEFCRNLDRRGVSGYHIWTHLKQEIEINTAMMDGKVYTLPNPYRYNGGIAEVFGFYVHPLTGLVCYRESPSKAEYRARRRRDEKSPEFVVPGDEAWSYKEFEGIWFRYRVTEHKRGCGATEYRISKRQANKKEVAWIKTQL